MTPIYTFLYNQQNYLSNEMFLDSILINYDKTLMLSIPASAATYFIQFNLKYSCLIEVIKFKFTWLVKVKVCRSYGRIWGSLYHLYRVTLTFYWFFSFFKKCILSERKHQFFPPRIKITVLVSFFVRYFQYVVQF